jgi:hypothetical protein
MPGADFVLDKGLLAQTALSKFRAVKGGTVDESCTAMTAVTELPLGVVQHAVAAADVNKQVADVRVLGITKMEASAAITRWAAVGAVADGRAVTAGAAGTRMLGIAMSAAGAAGDIIDVFLTPGAQVGTTF